MRFIGLLPVLLAAGLASAQDVRISAKGSGAASGLPVLEKASEVKDPDKLERSSKALGTMRGQRSGPAPSGPWPTPSM